MTPDVRPVRRLVLAVLLVLVPAAVLAAWAAHSAVRARQGDQAAVAASLQQVAHERAAQAVTALAQRLAALLAACADPDGRDDAVFAVAAERFTCVASGTDAPLPADIVAPLPLTPALAEARRLEFVVGDQAAAEAAYRAGLVGADPLAAVEARAAVIALLAQRGADAEASTLLDVALAQRDPPTPLAEQVLRAPERWPVATLFALWQRLDARTVLGGELVAALARRDSDMSAAQRAEWARQQFLRAQVPRFAAWEQRLDDDDRTALADDRAVGGSRWRRIGDDAVLSVDGAVGVVPIATWRAAASAAVRDDPLLERLRARVAGAPPLVAVAFPWAPERAEPLATGWTEQPGGATAASWLPWLMTAGAFTAVIAGLAIAIRAVRRELAVARLKEDYAARVSHELRTPLAVVQLNAETLALGYARDEGERRRCLDVLLGEVRRLALLVDSALDLARIARGARSYRRDIIDLAAVARAAVDALKPLLDRDGFQVDIALPDTASATGDADALTLAVMNLIANAHKFSPQERSVRVALDRDGMRWRLAVTDRGVGIPSDELPHLFAPYRRGAAAGTVRGAGLGLPLVRHVARGHGGDVAVVSAPGAGSTFTLVIPA